MTRINKLRRGLAARRRPDPRAPLRPRDQHPDRLRRPRRRLRDPHRRGPPRHPLRDDDDRRLGRRARDRRRARRARPRSARCRRSTASPRPRMPRSRSDGRPPFGRRLCEVTENRASGGYRVFSLLDAEGPEPQPGQFYMLATERHWEEQRRSGPSCRGRSRSPSGSGRGRGLRLDFLIEGIGPGTDRLCELEAGERGLGQRPARQRLLGAARSSPPAAAGAILVGGGIGIAPLALLRRQLRRAQRPDPRPARLPRRGALGRPRRPLRLLRGPPRQRGRPRRPPRLRHRPAGRDARRRRRRQRRRLRLRPAGDARRGRGLCAERDVACELAHGVPDGLRLRRLLRLRGAQSRTAATCASASTARSAPCRGVAPQGTPEELSSRGRVRRPLAGDRTRRSTIRVEFCGIELEHPVINASGTFDAIAARRVYGDALLEDFPFSAFVSKTITPEPRAGNEPQRIWETPAGMINSIGLPNKGLEGFLAEDLPQLAELPVPLIVSVMATEPRGVRAPGRGGRRARGGRRDRAQRLLPQRPLGADRRRAAGRDGGAAGGAAAADREAADREADARTSPTPPRSPSPPRRAAPTRSR